MKFPLPLLAAVTLLAGCTSATPATIHSIPPEALESRLADNDDAPLVILCEPGEAFNFTLAANATTGYRWQAEGAGDVARVDIVDEAPAQEKSMLTGVPGRVRVTITALKPGTAHIRLLYVRPWEKPLKPAKTLIIELGVDTDIAKKIQI